MSFSLRITFSGLCLFATGAQDRLHVLLVDHHGDTHDHADKHHPRLIFDKAYATPDSRKLSGNLACACLKRCNLRLDGFGDPIYPWLPKQVVHLDKIAKVGRLARRYVDNADPAHVIARVTTDSGNCTRCFPGARWTVTNGPSAGWKGEIATCVEWTIDVARSNKLTEWKRVPFTGEKEKKPLPTLYPIAGAIELFIYNLPMRDLPPSDRRSEQEVEAEHFEGYYQFFNTKGVIPRVEAPRKVIPCLPRPLRRSDCKPERQLTPQESRRMLTPRYQGCVVAQVGLSAQADGEP